MSLLKTYKDFKYEYIIIEQVLFIYYWLIMFFTDKAIQILKLSFITYKVAKYLSNSHEKHDKSLIC